MSEEYGQFSEEDKGVGRRMQQEITQTVGVGQNRNT